MAAKISTTCLQHGIPKVHAAVAADPLFAAWAAALAVVAAAAPAIWEERQCENSMIEESKLINVHLKCYFLSRQDYVLTHRQIEAVAAADTPADWNNDTGAGLGGLGGVGAAEWSCY